MALTLPLFRHESLKYSCTGNFLSPSILHLATLDSHGITFRSLSDDRGDQLRLPAAHVRVVIPGQVLRLFRIPAQATDGSNQNDILAIYCRVQQRSGNAEATDYIYFKEFNADAGELRDIGVAKFDVTRGSYGNPAIAEIAVCDIPGPNFGSIALVYASGDKVCFIHPSQPNKPHFHKQGATNGTSQLSRKVFWASNNVVALSIEGPAFKSDLQFIRIVRKSNPPKQKWESKTLSASKDVRAQRVNLVAPVPGNSNLAVALHLSFATLLKIKPNSIEISDTVKVGDDNTRPKIWHLLKSEDESALFANNAGDAFSLDTAPKFERYRCLYDPVERLDSLGAPYFLMYPSQASQAPIPKVVSLELSSETKAVVVKEVESIESVDYEPSRLLQHRFSEKTGSQYWAHLTNHTTESALVKLEQHFKSQRFELFRENSDEVTGVWLVDAQHSTILVSTRPRSFLANIDFAEKDFETKIFHSVNLANISPTWISQDSPTLAAGPGFQVCEGGKVFFENGKYIELDAKNVTAAAKWGNSVAVAAQTAVHILTDSDVHTISFDEPVVDISESSGKLLVLTVLGLHCIDSANAKNYQSLKVYETPACCMVSFASGIALVGFVNGEVREVLPTERSLIESTGSVFKLRPGKDQNQLILLGSDDFSIVDLTNNTVTRGPRQPGTDETGSTKGLYSDFLTLPNLPFIVTLKDGSLELIELQSETSGVYTSVVPPLKYNQDLQFLGSKNLYAYSPSTSKLALYDSEGSEGTGAVRNLPEYNVDGKVLGNQLYEISEDTLFQVVIYRGEGKNSGDGESQDGGNDSDSDDDDEDDDDDEEFTVFFLLRLIKKEVIESYGPRFVEVYSTTTSLLGDPYEEVVIKFLTPKQFTIFTHSVACVPGSISLDPPEIKLGTSEDTDTYVYDDHWIYDPKRNTALVVEFSGDIYKVALDSSLTSIPKTVSRSSKITSESDDMVFDVLQTYTEDRNSVRMLASISKPNNAPLTTLILFDYDLQSEQASRVATITLEGRPSKNIAVNDSFRAYLTSHGNEYIKAVSPEAVVSTENGTVQLLASFKDSKLAESLREIQRELLQILNSTGTRNSSSDNIDGALLLDALSLNETHCIFERHEIDPAKLKFTLESLLR